MYEKKEINKKMNKKLFFYHFIYSTKKNEKFHYSMIRMFESTSHALHILSIQKIV